MNIGIDLDDTIIIYNPKDYVCNNLELVKDTEIYLPKLYNNYKLHLINWTR